MLLVCLCLHSAPVAAAAPEPGVLYRLRVERPVEQLLHVEMELRAPLPLELVMPIWAPGSYRERHFVRNLKPGPARTASGRRLRWVRSGPDTFRLEDEAVATTSTQRLRVSYSVVATSFGDDLSHLDDEHAHLCGPGVFLLAPALRGAPHRLEITAPAGWRVATPLDSVPNRPGRYGALDYDELVDAPLELGRFAQAELRLGSRALRIAWHDAAGRPMPPRLLGQVRQIVLLHERWLGPLPYPRYLVVIHTREGQDYRGLEHARGASLIVPSSVLGDPDDYDDLLYVIAHEHLHVWNGKRLRPAEHLPYDYATARPTRMLWFTEGVTDYLARRTLLGIGQWRPERYLEQLGEELARVQRSPQRLWRSLSDISFEVWWPHRDAGEPPLTYYSKGHAVALLLDLELRGLTQGRAGVVELLRRLLPPSAARPAALTREGLERALAATAGTDLGARLGEWVDRPGELACELTLDRVGLRLTAHRLSPRPELGFSGSLQGGELLVEGVARGGPAARAGLVVGDRLLAIDGSRPTPGWRAQLGDPGRHALRLLRRGARREIPLRVQPHRPRALQLAPALASPTTAALRDAWLAP